jgi:hypothetical protein
MMLTDERALDRRLRHAVTWVVFFASMALFNVWFWREVAPHVH